MKHLQNILFVLPLSQQYCTIICHWHAAYKAITHPHHSLQLMHHASSQCTCTQNGNTWWSFIIFASSSVWNSIPNDVRCAHHCHHLSLVWRYTCFVQFTKTEQYPWYICAWFGLVIALLMVFLTNALMCIKKSQINSSWLSAYLMLLYIMLYIVLGYIMLLAALSNAVCLCNAFFFWYSFLQMLSVSCFVFVYWHISCLFQVWFFIMRSAFNLFVFPNSMFKPFLIWKG